MRYLLIAALALSLGACAAGRDRTSRPDPLAVALDGTPVVPPALPYAATHPVPKKCKGCSFYTIAGDATVAGKKAQVAAGEGSSLTITGKKSGPAVIGSDSSTLNAVGGGGNLAAVQGDGNTTTQTKADTEAPGVGATIAAKLTGPLGLVIGGALTCVLVAYGGSWVWGVWKRRKAAAQSQA